MPAIGCEKTACGGSNPRETDYTCQMARLPHFLLTSALLIGPQIPLAMADDQQPEAAPIPEGARIGRISFDRQNVFDTSKPEESGAFYRFFNRFHIMTRESTIAKQLLFDEGDVFDQRRIEETERVLRGNKFFFDASVTPELNDDGEVDIRVHTRDVWTLMPEISVSRSGGENKTVFGVEESNLFGLGQRVLITRTDDVDRTTNVFEYTNRQVGNSWVFAQLRLADKSDGDTTLVNLFKPFHELDARTAGGVTFYEDERRDALYFLGDEAAEYRRLQDRYSVFGGISNGLQDGWVRRWTAGVVYDENVFTDAAEPVLPQAVPEDRKLVYPFVGIEILEDRFEKSANRDQMERSEDFYLGTRIAASLGWSDTSFDADRDALLYSVSADQSFGSLDKRALLLNAAASGRVEDGDFANAVVGIDARYYWTQSAKRLFFATLDVKVGDNLDLDNPIEVGGDTGLRGYPLRYESGESRLLLTVEQRYFTDWYPFRLFRVGGALFADVGRVWGDNPLGFENQGWLTNVGFGFRFAPTRIGTRKIVHLDVAFPLDGDPSIDSVQILLEAKRSF